jgi:hypothetical protein
VPIGSTLVLAAALVTTSPRPASEAPSDDGVGLLATGGLLAVVGAALSALPLIHGVSCGTSTCTEPPALSRTAAAIVPAAYGLSSPFFAVGMYRARMARIHRELDRDPRRTVRPARPIALAGGIVMMAAGGALLGGAIALADSPYADAARWLGGPTLVCGSLMLGAATAQRHAYARRTSIAPFASRHTAGLAMTGRF